MIVYDSKLINGGINIVIFVILRTSILDSILNLN